MSIRALIVDDEPLARLRLRQLVEAEPGIELIGEATDGREGVDAVRELQPDLVFLDVQMPELDGFGMVEELGVGDLPAVVFVTAYDQHALRAFEVNAVDYLLKPFDRDRFRRAVERARQHLAARGGSLAREQLLSLLDDLKGGSRYVERLVVRTSGRVIFVKTADIDWVEAAGNYLRLHVGSESYLIRDTMAAMEARLDPRQFVRVHRSTLVNLERVKELQPLFHGEYAVLLTNGARLTLSRGYRDRLQHLLHGTI
ncbi:MAG TPA: LytTR family DNA-binding domain-containing protein [Thermoanaerobaculia bacterium]|nr:LytTR family DNA-binding domain-containing protein [Thermoanaerobaculia bacterium]